MEVNITLYLYRVGFFINTSRRRASFKGEASVREVAHSISFLE